MLRIFWNNPKEAEKLLKGIKQKKNWTDAFAALHSSYEDLNVLFEFFKAGDTTEKEVDAHYEETVKLLDDLEFKRMLGTEEDQLNAILNINSGAGGTESQDWAEMLMRMYIMWGERMVTRLLKSTSRMAKVLELNLQHLNLPEILLSDI
jgi:peptide chain release factor 2